MLFKRSVTISSLTLSLAIAGALGASGQTYTLFTDEGVVEFTSIGDTAGSVTFHTWTEKRQLEQLCAPTCTENRAAAEKQREVTKRALEAALLQLPPPIAPTGLAGQEAPAEVTLFQSKDMGMSPYSANKTRIYVDGMPTRLPSNHFFTVELAPGKHTVSSGAAMLIAHRVEIELNLKPGEHAYFIESMEMGLWQGRLALHRVSCLDMQGRHLAEKLKPVRADGVLPEEKFPEPVCESAGLR